ncbi:hypothetical protein J6590_076689, partial [Homalodisca vitripennis]
RTLYAKRATGTRAQQSRESGHSGSPNQPSSLSGEKGIRGEENGYTYVLVSPID